MVTISIFSIKSVAKIEAVLGCTVREADKSSMPDVLDSFVHELEKRETSCVSPFVQI